MPHSSAQRVSIKTAANHGLLVVDADYTDVPSPPAYIDVERHLLLKSLSRVDPHTIESVCNTRTGVQHTFSDAIDNGLLCNNDSNDLCYMHPMTGLAIPLAEAITEQYVTLRKESNTSHVGQEDQELFNGVTEVLDTMTGEYVPRETALREGMLDATRCNYIDRRSLKVIDMQRAVSRGLVKIGQPHTSSQANTQTTTTTRITDYRIRKVLNPVSGEWIPAATAVRLGVLDLPQGIYVNRITGVSRPLHEAYKEGLILADDESHAAIQLQGDRVHSVYDHSTKSPITLQQAVERGIITDDMSRYVVSETKEHISIAEAVQRGLVVMTTDNSVNNTSTVNNSQVVHESELLYQGVKSFTLVSVIDTRSGEEITMSDAIRHQIVNKERGEYIDMANDRVLTIDNAISRGLVMITRVEHSADEVANVGIAAQVYSLKEVRDVSTGQLYTPKEAESRGLVNKRKGVYNDTLSGDTISIGEAIARGFITAQLIEHPDYARLDDQDCYATLTRHHITTDTSNDTCADTNDLQQRHISGVIDVSTGETISILEAVNRGIITPSLDCYTLTTTGETMSLTSAVSRGFVCDVQPNGDIPRPHRTALVQAVYDSLSERWMQPEEAMVVGILNGNTLLYKGQSISLKQAERSGLLKILDEERSEDQDVHFTVETETSYITSNTSGAVKPLTFKQASSMGLIENGMFRHVDQQRLFTMSEAIERGFIATGEFGHVSSVVDAIEDGRVNVAKKEFVHSGRRMPVKTACLQNLLSVEPVGPTLTLREAVARDLLDASTALFADPTSGRVSDVDSAMREGLLSRENAGYNLEGGVGFGEAFREFMITEDVARFKHPKHGRMFTLADAISLGYLCIAPSDANKTAAINTSIATSSISSSSTLHTKTTRTKVEHINLNTDGTITRSTAEPCYNVTNGNQSTFDTISAGYSDSPMCRLDSSYNSFDSQVSTYSLIPLLMDCIGIFRVIYICRFVYIQLYLAIVLVSNVINFYVCRVCIHCISTFLYKPYYNLILYYIVKSL